MNKKTNIAMGSLAVIIVALVSLAIPAFAQVTAVTDATITTNTSVPAAGINTNTSVHISAATAASVKNIVDRADREIDRRILALNALYARVNAMQKLSGAEKGSLSSDISTQLGEMTALKAQVATDAAANDTSTLKLDAQSITRAYRIFALVLPQGAIEAAADRVLTTADIMTDLATKFSSRISTASSSGTDVSAATVALTDMNAKVSDADVQATAAAGAVFALKPDNGDASVKASNMATLKDARAKVVAAQKDLIATRADAQTIIKALGINISTSASATSSAAAR